jgi:hypothetical protein
MKATASRLQEIPAIAARHSAVPDASRLSAAPRRGRPSKFGRSARAITVTLPEDAITTLMALNLDIGRAIVQLCETHASQLSRALPPPVELSTYGGTGALILIAPVGTLKRVPGVELIPLTDGRALISLDDSKTLQTLELHVRDALELDMLSDEDRAALTGLADVLRGSRRGDALSLRTRTIIVIEPTRRPKPARR